MTKNESFVERVKAGSRKAFMGIGNMAVGNATNDNNKMGYIEPVPFSWGPLWSHEKSMPKRRNK